MKEIIISSKKGNYQIIIGKGALKNINKFLDSAKKYVLIHDDLIPEQYIANVRTAFKDCLEIPFPAGEKSKSFSEFERIIKIMQTNDIKRDACIIALGGGVTGDLSGFIASVYMRGIDYVHVPTSLLAQIDSSIGGKVAINTEFSKNSIGSFYPPKMVIVDPSALSTLPERQFSNGMAEMIKYGMIASRKLFDELKIKKIDEIIEEMIYESINIKKFFVEKDEFDKTIRRALNFGHTFGHAYESYYKYSKYLHGEAIALGMLELTLNRDAKEALVFLLKKYNLPTKDEIDLKELDSYIKRDKKNTQNSLNMIIVKEIGKYEIVSKNI